MNRRRFIEISAAHASALLLACDDAIEDPLPDPPDAATLVARPHGPTEKSTTGFVSLGIPSDGFIYVPPGYTPDRAAPLLLLLHGAGGSPEDFNSLPLASLADPAGLILLCPKSRSGTWDLSLGGFGPDVRFIDASLARVFREYNISRYRIALGGFSNGASYALSLGVYNGDLFSALVAFSPGFYTPPGKRGLPRIFASHGTRDPLLNNTTTPQIVPRLTSEGYSVTYRLFDGGHEVPVSVAQEAIQWLTAG
jgi:predicted esterase